MTHQERLVVNAWLRLQKIMHVPLDQGDDLHEDNVNTIYQYDGPAILRHVCEVLDLDNSRPIHHVIVRRRPVAHYDDGLDLTYIERRKRTRMGRTFAGDDPAWFQVIVGGVVAFDSRVLAA